MIEIILIILICVTSGFLVGHYFGHLEKQCNMCKRYLKSNEVYFCKSCSEIEKERGA